MSGGSSTSFTEPTLAVRRKFYLRRRFLFSFLPLACAAVVGTGALAASGHVLGPLDRPVTLKAAMASKKEFFEDEQVRRRLSEHGLRLDIAVAGSRHLAVGKLDGYDLAFPSGLSTAELITDDRSRRGLPFAEYQPFASPVVLATYREYAEALVSNGIATRRGGKDTLYYDLKMSTFVGLMKDGTKWDDPRFGLDNRNRVEVRTPELCWANSAGTYLAMVAYALSESLPQTNQEADALAAELRPLLGTQGQGSPDLHDPYFDADGRRSGPITVIYEHQYLAHQLRHAERTDKPDDERVLLYPDAAVNTLPRLIAFTSGGNRLGELLRTDPQLRRRALELGFQVLGPNGGGSQELDSYLVSKKVPAPGRGEQDTRTPIPRLPALERMITAVGGCHDR